MTEPVENARQKVRVVFMHKTGSVIVKLVEPTDETSPVQALARRGGGMHHVCFRCHRVDIEMKRLEAEGARSLALPQPGEAFDGGTIAFLFCENGLNVELIDTDKKSGTIGEKPNAGHVGEPDKPH